ncbi:MAG: GTPase Era [Desulfobacteraceae bacterium]|nr:GTPase Era [Desulfobacteraceae bacterium]MCF8094971.1 GTPase Era [Desulfobacteraceae bacterium]
MTEEQENRQQKFKSGFTVISGAPNAGKSTLLNLLVGEKISITSAKPQTTRNRIAGIAHGPGFQIVFLDTPGVHKSERNFNRRIVDVAWDAFDEADLVLMIADAARPDSASESLIMEKLRDKTGIPAVLALNKIDLVEKPKLLEQIDRWSKKYEFAEIIPVSATQGIQIPELVDAMTGLLPEGPPYFPEDAITDMPERFIVAEMIREKVFENTGQEVPYSTAVTIEDFSEDGKNGRISIHAAIHVERNSQKGIVIGRHGQMLKSIGTAARHDIERLLGIGVFLKLFVRVEKNWSKNPKVIKKLGY